MGKLFILIKQSICSQNSVFLEREMKWKFLPVGVANTQNNNVYLLQVKRQAETTFFSDRQTLVKY